MILSSFGEITGGWEVSKVEESYNRMCDRRGGFPPRHDVSVQHGIPWFAKLEQTHGNRYFSVSKFIFFSVMIQHLFSIPVLPGIRSPEVTLPSCLFSLGVATWVAFYPLIPLPRNSGVIIKNLLALIQGAFTSALSYQLIWLNLVRILKLVLDFLVWIITIIASDAGISLERIQEFFLENFDENTFNCLYTWIMAVLFTGGIFFQLWKQGHLFNKISLPSFSETNNLNEHYLYPSRMRSNVSKSNLLIQGPYQAYSYSDRKQTQNRIRFGSLNGSSDEMEDFN